MHDSAFRIGELVMRTYCDLAHAKVLEIGSLNVNGCLRDAAAPTTIYIGLDLEPGPSVDMVIAPGGEYPVENDSFDLVMASSVFEHDPRFWETFLRMCRAARPGGHIYVNAPSNGTVHRYPMDYWRFYPDAGLALADYARACGLEVDLVESFTGHRHSDVWNDFVAVFRKGPSADPLNTAFVYQRYPCSNVRTWQSSAVFHGSEATEDMAILARLRQQVDEAAAQTDATEALRDQIAQLEQALAQKRQQEQERSDELTHLAAAMAGADQDRERLGSENADLASRAAVLQSHLVQRQEEVDQAWLRVRELEAEREALRDQVEQLHAAQAKSGAELIESEKWVYDLAGQRRKLEQRLAAVEVALAAAERTIVDLKRDGAVREQQLRDHHETNRALAGGVARLRALRGSAEQIAAQAHDLHSQWHAEQHPLTGLAAVVRDALAPGSAPASSTMLREDEPFVGQTVPAQHKAALHANIEKLVARVTEQQRALFDEQARTAQLHETIAALRAEALGYHAKASTALEQLEVLRAEHGQQARKLRAVEERAAKKDRDLMWMRRLYQLMDYAGSGWRGLLPPALRRRVLNRLLIGKRHFDGPAYLEKYADVAASGMDPLRHYVNHGMAEGRFVDLGG
ncbi:MULTISPECIES: methyltransferase domain-containing protein [unclassified Novosphingobium]|uniref:methyltransferase domain-containing protein n=1 Tax=unclassified Novosphingobium TaxID=2644732 RepID=UPI001494F55F|nr:MULTISPECIES: methyltransferase domain-containing protein [unclassified Novosphingobium]MBB3356494.1 SAM-dependent methyltransferase [Novosphingobium sp. BK256]MBB3372895.1 SAM-dependent methyltransferase [Novosphingobium sp. BK280]MBB3377263.1 SAM-dependent methyltransferase [Novosphingobium sp. BK258]MBB3419326.1 SAM-dependent methyltransferase [Novosphingobium sp. BK267]MBB3448857.1 SAM-dependent methyltransferase [Novosphingobium sp. BK352]